MCSDSRYFHFCQGPQTALPPDQEARLRLSVGLTARCGGQPPVGPFVLTSDRGPDPTGQSCLNRPNMQTSLAALLLLGLATSLATAATTAKATDKTDDDAKVDDITTNMDDATTKIEDIDANMEDSTTKEENTTISIPPSIPTFKALHCPPGFAKNSSCSTKFCVVTCGNGQYFFKDIETDLYHLLPPARAEGMVEEGDEVEEEDKEEEKGDKEEEGDDVEEEDKEDGEEEDKEDLEEENNKGDKEEEEEDKEEEMNNDE